MRTLAIILAITLQMIFIQPALAGAPKTSKDEALFNANIEQINAEIEAAIHSSDHSRQSLLYEIDKLMNYTLIKNPDLIFEHIAKLIHIAITQAQQSPAANPSYRTSAYSSEQLHHPSTYALGQRLTTDDIIALLINVRDIISAINYERNTTARIRDERIAKASKYIGVASAIGLGLWTNSALTFGGGIFISQAIATTYQNRVSSYEYSRRRGDSLDKQFTNQLQTTLGEHATPYISAYLSRKYHKLKASKICEDPLLSILVNSAVETHQVSQMRHQVRIGTNTTTEAEEDEVEVNASTQTRTHEL